MTNAQKGILLPPPPLAMYLSFDLAVDGDIRAALARLAGQADGE